MIKAESFFSLSLNTSSNHQQQQQEQHEMVEVEEMERKGSHIILSFFTFLAASSSSSSPLSHLRPPNTSSIHQQQQREQHEMVEVEVMAGLSCHIIQFGLSIIPFSSHHHPCLIFVHLICRTLTTCKNKNNMRC